MSVYPGAVWEPLAQNATQSRIVPIQVILHSTTSPNDQGIWEYFEHGSGGAGTESHFLVDYAGGVIQAMDTQVRADAQWDGNTHAVSIETASNGAASDAWTPAQSAAIVALCKWLLTVHTGIGRRECRTEADPGFGYHRLFAAWNHNNHSCPGDLRVKQFPLLLSQIVAPAQPVEDDVDVLFQNPHGVDGQPPNAVWEAFPPGRRHVDSPEYHAREGTVKVVPLDSSAAFWRLPAVPV